jgi:IPT/TIG domain/S-layer homology domain
LLQPTQCLRRLKSFVAARRPLAAVILGVTGAFVVAAGPRNTAAGAPTPQKPARAARSGSLITVCVNGDIWVDGGFEATSPVTLLNPNYVVTSTLFPSSLCNLAHSLCQDGEGPRTGQSWMWAGGNDLTTEEPEIDSAEQTITFPSGAQSVTLRFYMMIGFVNPPATDTLEVQVDGVTQATWLEPLQAETTYTQRSVDLTGFANGAAHAVKFLYTEHLTGQPNRADFNIDDVTLDIVCAPQVSAIDPNSGPASGGTAVVVTGSGFVGGDTLLIGNSTAIGTVVVGPTEIDATVPPLTPGTLNDVTVPRPLRRLPQGATLANASLVNGWLADFLDVPESEGFHDYIETIFRLGITAGYGNGYYGINDSVTRAQMAVFILKASHAPGFAPPPCTGIFNDVECTPNRAFAVDWIEELFHEGITVGCDVDKYCPDEPVTRAHMAVFLLKAEHGSGHTPPPCTGIFSDVECTPNRAFAVDWIEQLFTEGITAGCDINLYCPDQSSTRGQMAVLLVKTFGLP